MTGEAESDLVLLRVDSYFLQGCFYQGSDGLAFYRHLQLAGYQSLHIQSVVNQELEMLAVAGGNFDQFMLLIGYRAPGPAGNPSE